MTINYSEAVYAGGKG